MLDDTDIPDEKDCRERLVDLQARVNAMQEELPDLLHRITEALRMIGGKSELADDWKESLGESRGDAITAIENYTSAARQLGSASLALGQLPAAAAERRGQLLQGVDGLLNGAEDLVSSAEYYYEKAQDPDPSNVPPSILDD